MPEKGRARERGLISGGVAANLPNQVRGQSSRDHFSGVVRAQTQACVPFTEAQNWYALENTPACGRTLADRRALFMNQLPSAAATLP